MSQGLAPVKLKLNSLSACYSTRENQHHSTENSALKRTRLKSLHARKKLARFCVAELPDDPPWDRPLPSKLRSVKRGIFVPGP